MLSVMHTKYTYAKQKSHTQKGKNI